jgi:hypothetical protein
MCSQPTRVPSGYVVTAIYNSGTCGVYGEFGNTYLLEIPASGMAICNEASRPPAGWIVVSIYNSGACGAPIGNGGGNTSVIQP